MQSDDRREHRYQSYRNRCPGRYLIIMSDVLIILPSHCSLRTSVQTHLWGPQPSQTQQTATWPVRPSVSPPPGGRTTLLSPHKRLPRTFAPVSHPNIGLYGAFSRQIHRIWGGAILTTGGGALRSQEGYSKFQLIHPMGNGNLRGMDETDCPNMHVKSQWSSAKPLLSTFYAITRYVYT